MTGNYVINDPIVENRGFAFSENTEKDMDAEILSVVRRAVESYDYENGTKDELSGCVYRALKNFIFKKTKKSPLIVVTVLDV